MKFLSFSIVVVLLSWVCFTAHMQPFSLSYTVLDKAPPTVLQQMKISSLDSLLSCPQDTFVYAPAGFVNCSLAVNWSLPYDSSNLPNHVIATSNVQPGDSFCLDSTLVIYSLIDTILQDTYTCDFYVIVVDTMTGSSLGSLLICPQDTQVYAPAGFVNCSLAVNWSLPYDSSNLPNHVIATSNVQPGDSFCLDSTRVIYSLIDTALQDTYTCDFHVIVIDTMATLPLDSILVCPPDTIVYAPDSFMFCSVPVSWDLPYDSLYLTDSMVVNSNYQPGTSFSWDSTEIIYTLVNKAAQDTYRCSFWVVVEDNIAPVATCLDYNISVDPLSCDADIRFFPKVSLQ